jgi:glycosyltransferase involved in cell wall biosynthesis
MKVLLATDAFPPIAGGSGWSTYELARGLRALGHEVLIVQPRPGTPRGVRERSFDGFPVLEAGFPASGVPYLRNYFKNERLWRGLSALLSETAARERVEIVHGQHVLTALPSIDAAHGLGLPAVCTVRDYWPVCYWSDLLHTREGDVLCPACSMGGMAQCVRPRAGVLWPGALPMIPYMRANLARKRGGLAAADAIVAVSTAIASDLRARAPELAGARIETIPNAIDVADIRTRARASRPPMSGPYALYLGKHAPNKGTQHLVDIARRADSPAGPTATPPRPGSRMPRSWFSLHAAPNRSAAYCSRPARSASRSPPCSPAARATSFVMRRRDCCRTVPAGSPPTCGVSRETRTCVSGLAVRRALMPKRRSMHRRSSRASTRCMVTC